MLRAPPLDVHHAFLSLSSNRFTTFPPVHPLLSPSAVIQGTLLPSPARSEASKPIALPSTDAGYDSDPEAKARRADVASTMADVDKMLQLEDDAIRRGSNTFTTMAGPVAVRARHAAVLLSRSPLFPPLVVRPGEKVPRRVITASCCRVRIVCISCCIHLLPLRLFAQDLISNYVKLYPLLVAAGLSDVTGHRAGTDIPS